MPVLQIYTHPSSLKHSFKNIHISVITFVTTHIKEDWDSKDLRQSLVTSAISPAEDHLANFTGTGEIMKVPLCYSNNPEESYKCAATQTAEQHKVCGLVVWSSL